MPLLIPRTPILAYLRVLALRNLKSFWNPLKYLKVNQRHARPKQILHLQLFFLHPLPECTSSFQGPFPSAKALQLILAWLDFFSCCSLYHHTCFICEVFSGLSFCSSVFSSLLKTRRVYRLYPVPSQPPAHVSVVVAWWGQGSAPWRPSHLVMDLSTNALTVFSV